MYITTFGYQDARSMPDPLVQHIRKFVTIEEQDAPEILSFFQHITVSKKENLLREGEACKVNYFVVKGCLRMFFVNEKGIEQTTQFAIENWWLADYMSLLTGQPSGFFIQAVEQSEVRALHIHAQEQLFIKFPSLERYFRLVYQKAYAASQIRMKYLHDYSREEMYYHFINNFPGFVQRIPQYLLASYLGFTPEYLSEIRKKYVLKPV